MDWEGFREKALRITDGLSRIEIGKLVVGSKAAGYSHLSVLLAIDEIETQYYSDLVNLIIKLIQKKDQ